MGLIKAFAGAIGGAFADSWKDIIVPAAFDEMTAVVPGVKQGQNNGRGSNTKSSYGIITNDSKVYVPENTAAIIFNEGGLTDVITEPGGFTVTDGEPSIFTNSDLADGLDALIHESWERFKFGGQPAAQKAIVYVNLREIRGNKFGTPGPLVYNDAFYGADLEVLARGQYTIKIKDPIRFLKEFVPANTTYYSFADDAATSQLFAEFIAQFNASLNGLSATYRISQLPAQSLILANAITGGAEDTNGWLRRFGLSIEKIAIESIEFSQDSRELVKQFNTNRMSTMAFANIPTDAANVAAQQKIAQGVENHGLGDGGGLMLGANIAGTMGNPMATPAQSSAPVAPSPVEKLKQLKEMLDVGLISQTDFDTKKAEILSEM